jgi:hypothetical protein
MTAFQDSPPPLPDPTLYPPTQRSVWPSVIGIISIVLASLGIICMPIGLAFNSYNRMNPKQAELMADFPSWYGTYQIASSILYVMLYVLLLVAGILLVRRRLAAARSAHLIFALANLLALGVGMAMLAVLNQAISQSVSSDMRHGMQVGLMFGGACTLIIAGAYPVFLLVWFSRSRIRQEINAWKAAQGQL